MSEDRCQMSERRERAVGPAMSVERLEVFQHAYRISLVVHRTSLGFPPIEQRALADPMRHASKSICANLVEGFAKQSSSRAEFRRLVIEAWGLAEEMRLWSCYCHDLGHIDEATWRSWVEAYECIGRMLRDLAGQATPV